MTPPPTLLDGARVLWWAWSGERPFGELWGAPEPERWVHGFAVCRYDGAREVYRFSCTASWQVVQDSLHDDEDEAKAAVPTNYDASRVVWRRAGA